MRGIGYLLVLPFFWSACATSAHAVVHEPLDQTMDKTVLLLGEERLDEPAFLKQIAGKRIGVLAHHASRDHQGKHIVDRLAAMPGVQLKMIFAPEHGYRSLNDELTPDSIDSVTGLPVYSLYGPRKAPTPDLLKDLDLVIIDLQDVGLRYYTYPATMVYTLQACKVAGKPVMILDRPNPLGGTIVEGSVLEVDLATGGLTNLAPIPTRHGMTMGELARYYNESLNIHADLTVVPMQGWQREMDWVDTKLPWTPPSPALVQTDQAILYSIFGTLEATSLAVGRGQKNDLAFRVFGAPWVTEEEQAGLVARLNALQLRNVKFEAYTWTPDRSENEGKLCRGFRVTMNSSISAASTYGLNVLTPVLETMKSVLGSKLDLSDTLVMLGSHWLLQGIETQSSVLKIVHHAEHESVSFLSQRAKVLLY